MYSKMPTEFFFQALDGQLYNVATIKKLPCEHIKASHYWPASGMPFQHPVYLTPSHRTLQQPTRELIYECGYSKHIKEDHFWPVGETSSQWRFASGPIVARDWMLTVEILV